MSEHSGCIGYEIEDVPQVDVGDVLLICFDGKTVRKCIVLGQYDGNGLAVQVMNELGVPYCYWILTAKNFENEWVNLGQPEKPIRLDKMWWEFWR